MSQALLWHLMRQSGFPDVNLLEKLVHCNKQGWKDRMYVRRRTDPKIHRKGWTGLKWRELRHMAGAYDTFRSCQLCWHGGHGSEKRNGKTGGEHPTSPHCGHMTVSKWEMLSFGQQQGLGQRCQMQFAFRIRLEHNGSEFSFRKLGLSQQMIG